VGNPIKKLASQTAIYGLSSIVGRFLNYLLTPLWTGAFIAAQFGVITEMYAYVAFLVILLTYGLETSYFRFTTKSEFESNNVFTTIMSSLIVTSSLFIGLAFFFSQEVAESLLYPNHSEYVIWFAIIVGFDALTSIPQAYLRKEHKALKFSIVNLGNVGINIFLNLFFIFYCKQHYDSGNTNYIIDTFYNPEIGVGYVFIANLVASIFKLALLTPEILLIRNGKFKKTYLKPILSYSIPLLFVGMAGIINETLDRILLKRLLIEDLGFDETMKQIGIYGANYKLSILITLFIQAYRYAAEPFFFAKEKDNDSKQLYANIMTYFVIVVCTIFLFVVAYLDIFKYFINNEVLWEGLVIVPILLAANVFLGIYYNLSIWYKLSQKTSYGALISIGGALVTIVLNLILIPKMGYEGAAWATLICYLLMVIASYILGQKHYPINYDLKRIIGYMLFALLLFLTSNFLISPLPNIEKYTFNTLILAVYLGVAYYFEGPKKQITK
jgi:O-antigen/teichoic acid export membrane protein